MTPLIFRIALALVVLYALAKGRRDEKVVAAICVVGALASHGMVSPLNERYGDIEWGVFAVDFGVFAGFTAVALQSSRFWPLWVAGLQMTTLIGHMLKGVQSELLPLAYGAALQFWSYPIVLILFIGTWRSARRWRPQDEPVTS